MNSTEKKIYKKVNKLKRPYTDREMLDLYSNMEDKHSARYSYILGDKQRIQYGKKYLFFKNYIDLRLMDKTLYPIDICPYCSSEDTFHKRHLERGIAGTCWDTREILDIRKGELLVRTLLKFDYCLECQQIFLIESYAWKRIKENE